MPGTQEAHPQIAQITQIDRRKKDLTQRRKDGVRGPDWGIWTGAGRLVSPFQWTRVRTATAAPLPGKAPDGLTVVGRPHLFAHAIGRKALPSIISKATRGNS
jgi:hypothetical protein